MILAKGLGLQNDLDECGNPSVLEHVCKCCLSAGAALSSIPNKHGPSTAEVRFGNIHWTCFWPLRVGCPFFTILSRADELGRRALIHRFANWTPIDWGDELGRRAGATGSDRRRTEARRWTEARGRRRHQSPKVATGPAGCAQRLNNSFHQITKKHARGMKSYQKS